MKNHLIITISTGLLIYLCGSFINASFNIKEWGQLGREFMGFAGFVLIVLFNAMVITSKNL